MQLFAMAWQYRFPAIEVIPPPQTPGHLRFLKHFGQIPRYVASLHGQMPHPLELQKSFKEGQIVNSNVHIL